MLTQQLRNFLVAQYATVKLEDNTTSQNQVGISNFLSNFFGGSPYNYTYTNGTATSNGIHWAVALGTGDTEPTFEDICLASKTSPSDMTWLSGSSARQLNTMLWSITCVFKNTSSAPITIKEVGLLLYTNSTSNNKGALIARSVLETPVTVGVNETYAFTYEIELA